MSPFGLSWRLPAVLLSALLLPTLLASAQTLDALTLPREGRSRRASSGNLSNNEDSAKFGMGETRTLAELSGPGKITHMWFTPNSMDIRYPRALVLRIYWDGATVPSVEVPLGDFFAVGNGMRADVNSLPVKVSSYGRGYNCYWQMPFQKNAKYHAHQRIRSGAASCYYHIDWIQLDDTAAADVLSCSLPSRVSAGI